MSAWPKFFMWEDAMSHPEGSAGPATRRRSTASSCAGLSVHPVSIHPSVRPAFRCRALKSQAALGLKPAPSFGKLGVWFPGPEPPWQRDGRATWWVVVRSRWAGRRGEAEKVSWASKQRSHRGVTLSRASFSLS